MFASWLFPIGLILAGGCVLRFVARRDEPYPPVWLFLAAWALGITIPQLHLSEYEQPWSLVYWALVLASVAFYVIGDAVFTRIAKRVARSMKREAGGEPNRQQNPEVTSYTLRAARTPWFHRPLLNPERLRCFIYALFALSLLGLWRMYDVLGTFPLLHPSPDAFRFELDSYIFGGWVYAAQLGRLFVPACFLLIFQYGFRWRRDYDLAGLILIGVLTQLLFATRTSLFFIDILIMSFYLLIRRPNARQALKFYPAFLLVAVAVLATVPLIRQWKSYGTDYLEQVTGVRVSPDNPLGKFLVPIYVGVAFNQQALYHADVYYQRHPIQRGRVSADIFTHAAGLDQLGPDVNLGEIFFSWWNTGTYLFPFVQDFGRSAFYWMPVLMAAVAVLAHRFWLKYPNFLSIWLLAYTYFFLIMSIYLSYTVRPELYLGLFFLGASYWFVASHHSNYVESYVETVAPNPAPHV